MKYLRLTFILQFLFLLSCNNGSIENSISEPNNNSKEDSISKVYSDSLKQIEAENQAYLNRTWKLGNYNDEFGEATKEKYIKAQIEGNFSNSATSNSNLYVSILIDKDAAGIFLHEYEETRPAEKFIGTARIKMKNSSGKELQIFSSSEWNQGGGIRIENFTQVRGAEDYDYSNFIKFLKKSEGEIKVVIYDEYSSSYRFNLNSSGFSKEYKLL